MTKTAEILEALEAEALKKWGNHWLAPLARDYSKKVYNSEDKYRSAYAQLQRLFKNKSCNLETALAIADCVDCEFQLTCHRPQIIKLGEK